MIVYVVIVHNQLIAPFEEFYVKCVESTKEKARSKIEKLMDHFLKSYDRTWSEVSDYGDMLVITIDGQCYTVWYEDKTVLLEG